jgi:hypothetical protein
MLVDNGVSCLRSDGILEEADRHRLRCPSCGQQYARGIVADVPRSVWDALRRGYRPLLGSGYNRVRLTLNPDTLLVSEDHEPEWRRDAVH